MTPTLAPIVFRRMMIFLTVTCSSSLIRVLYYLAFANQAGRGVLSFPGSAWERTEVEALPRRIARRTPSILHGRRSLLCIPFPGGAWERGQGRGNSPGAWGFSNSKISWTKLFARRYAYRM